MSHFTVAKSASQGCRRVEQPKALFLSFVFDSETGSFITAQPAFKDRGSVSIQCFFFFVLFSESGLYVFTKYGTVMICCHSCFLCPDQIKFHSVFFFLFFWFVCWFFAVVSSECFRFSVYALTMFKKFEVSMCLKNDKLKRDWGTNHSRAPIAA